MLLVLLGKSWMHKFDEIHCEVDNTCSFDYREERMCLSTTTEPYRKLIATPLEVTIEQVESTNMENINHSKPIKVVKEKEIEQVQQVDHVEIVEKIVACAELEVEEC